MKKIINGKRYDTDTATAIGEHEESSISEFNYVSETLYRKRNGEYFLHGYGHAASRYSRTSSTGGWVPGEKIIPLTYVDAMRWAEKNLEVDEYESEFGEVSENGDDTVLTIRISISTKIKLDRLVAKTGKTKGELLTKAIDLL